jgi:hypothetical protein
MNASNASDVLQKQQAGINQNYDNSACSAPAGYSNMMPKQDPLLIRLQRRARSAEEEHAKVTRVLDILQRHPEFEEFIEFLNSGLVY